jgi:hypothetical protein
MIRRFFILIFGIAAGAGVLWLATDGSGLWRTQTEAARSVEPVAEPGIPRPPSHADPTAAALAEELTPESILAELEQTGRVVRRRAVRASEAGSEDSRTAAAIERRLAMHPRLKSFKISAEVEGQRATLSGIVTSPEHIALAMRIAMQTGETREVVSVLLVRQMRADGAK